MLVQVDNRVVIFLNKLYQLDEEEFCIILAGFCIERKAVEPPDVPLADVSGTLVLVQNSVKRRVVVRMRLLHYFGHWEDQGSDTNIHNITVTY